MIWLTWRQHRQQALFAVLALAALALFLVPTGRQMHHAFQQLGLPDCLRRVGTPAFVHLDGHGCGALGEQFSGRFQNLAFLSLLLLILPLLVGMFWGAPLVARELEHGTHRLVWTQGISRRRWALTRLGPLIAGVVVVAGCHALLASWWVSPLNRATGYRFTWLFFDAQGPVLIGYAVFALALGVFAGVLTRRTQAAMAVTLVGFLAVRLGVAILVRPRLLAPLRRSYPVVGDLEPNQLNGDWVLSRGVHSAQGVKLTPGIGTQALCGAPATPECVARFGPGAYNLDLYQPASRYWLFQGIETALFIALAALLLLAAIRFIQRRLA